MESLHGFGKADFVKPTLEFGRFPSLLNEGSAPEEAEEDASKDDGSPAC